MVTRSDLVVFGVLPFVTAAGVRWLLIRPSSTRAKPPATEEASQATQQVNQQGNGKPLGFAEILGSSIALSTAMLVVVFLADFAESRRVYQFTAKGQPFSPAIWFGDFSRKLLHPQEIGVWCVWCVVLGLFVQWLTPVARAKRESSLLPPIQPMQFLALGIYAASAGGLLYYFLANTVFLDRWSFGEAAGYVGGMWIGWLALWGITLLPSQDASSKLSVVTGLYVQLCVAVCLFCTGSLRLGLVAASFSAAWFGCAATASFSRRSDHRFATAGIESYVFGILILHACFLSQLPVWGAVTLFGCALARNTCAMTHQKYGLSVALGLCAVVTTVTAVLVVGFFGDLNAGSGANLYYR